MWTIKTFKTLESYNKWIECNKHRYQISPIYINNGYGVEYKNLRVINFD